MLRCTACQLEIAPFALQRPTEERRCGQCGAELVFTKASRLDVVVEGPSLPPVPKGVSVQRAVEPRSYRENASDGSLAIRWRPASGPQELALLGSVAGLDILLLLGAFFLGPPLWLPAVLFSSLTILLVLSFFFARGEVRVEAGTVRSRGRGGKRRELSAPRDSIAEVRIVQVGHEQSPSIEIWAEMADGAQRPLVRGLPSGGTALFITALLRRELRLQRPEA